MIISYDCYEGGCFDPLIFSSFGGKSKTSFKMVIIIIIVIVVIHPGTGSQHPALPVGNIFK